MAVKTISNASIQDQVFELGSEFESLKLAYEEYNFLLTEVRDGGFEQGGIISCLNEKLDMLTSRLYELK